MKERTNEMRTTVTRLAVIVGIVFWIGFGLWAFIDPRSFFDALATFRPYNKHFLHDIGAFQIGIGAGLYAATRWRDSLLVALAASAVAASLHFVSHVIDRDLGGRPTDLVLLGLLTALFILGAVARRRNVAL